MLHLLPLLSWLLLVVERINGFTIPSAFIQSHVSTVSVSSIPAAPAVWVAAAEDIALEEAFQDTVDVSLLLSDGPVRTILIVFVLVIAILGGLKVFGNKMDSAIEQVLVEFAETMQQFHPQRWEAIQTDLADLTGDDYDRKLLSVMADMEREEPDFMVNVKQQMGEQNN